MTERVRLMLDHIAIASPDLRETIGRIERLFGAAASEIEEVPEEKVRLAFVPAGGTRIEVLEGTHPDSPVRRFLERRPPGLHHLSFGVEGLPLDDWFELLKSRGIRVLGDAPGAGADGKRIFFVHPDATGGVLVEFTQPSGTRETS